MQDKTANAIFGVVCVTALLPSTARRGDGFGVVETMADVILARGVPGHIQSDNDAEMTVRTFQLLSNAVPTSAIIPDLVGSRVKF
jgi:hypothetical protein